MSDRLPRLNKLFQQYLSKAITRDEYLELLSLLNSDDLSHSLTPELKELWHKTANLPPVLPDEIWDAKIKYLIKELNEEYVTPAPVKKIIYWYKLRWAVAAIFFLVCLPGIYYFFKTSGVAGASKDVSVKKNNNKTVLPGGNKAVLILADGSSVLLDSAANGTIANQGATKIIKLPGGKLVYNSSDQNPAAISYNTLSTPRGGQYQVTLPDGTIVWLNSASSLRYPTVFTGKERRVEISGEAYFEVAKNTHQPFKIKINLSTGEGGEVEVLGTHFNINAYDNETTVRTTLFEGSVKINRLALNAQLKPGQQCRYGLSGEIKIVNDADMEEVIAWKEGRFQFENADISYVMRQLARWYDIEVKYNENISRHFTGSVSRNVNMLKVLNMLELTGEVNFNVEGKKVFVLP
jgi:transmembrane sensor